MDLYISELCRDHKSGPSLLSRQGHFTTGRRFADLAKIALTSQNRRCQSDSDCSDRSCSFK